MKKLTKEDLRANPKNPRSISDEKLKALAKSIHTFGDLSSVIFNYKSGHLVGGHQRLKAIGDDYEIIMEDAHLPDKQGTIGCGEIEFGKGLKLHLRIVEWDEKTETAAMLAANAHGGEFNLPELKEILLELDDGTLDMDLTGFLDKEIEEMMTAAPPEDKPDKDKEQKLHRCPECGHQFKDSEQK